MPKLKNFIPRKIKEESFGGGENGADSKFEEGESSK
jgi:hypothetical protein